MAKSKSAAKKNAPEVKKRVRAKQKDGAQKDTAKKANGSAAVVGFEQKLWQAADKMRNNMDAAEYKHVVLGLIFLKYISDAFEEKHAVLEAEKKSGADPEDPDEYRADNIFWVPKEARWPHLQGKAKQPTIGKLIDDAMVAIERDNPPLKGVLPPGIGIEQVYLGVIPFFLMQLAILVLFILFPDLVTWLPETLTEGH